jgi:hypothetical protein
MPDKVRANPVSGYDSEGIENKRFSGPGLAGEDI